MVIFGYIILFDLRRKRKLCTKLESNFITCLKVVTFDLTYIFYLTFKLLLSL